MWKLFVYGQNINTEINLNLHHSLQANVILVLIWCTRLCDAQVTLELCAAPIKDENCVLECYTPDLTQSVVFKKDNTEYASCKYILGTLSCTSIYPKRSLISQQINVTSLNITQLSRAGDQGSWTCDYGSSGSSAQTLTVLTAPSQISIPDYDEADDIDYCAGDQGTKFDVTLTITCSSAVNVSAELSSPARNPGYTKNLRVTKGDACSDVAENIYTAVLTITSTTGGDYTLKFKTQLSAEVGEVYETVFPGDIVFPCQAPSRSPTLKPNNNMILYIIILISIIITIA